MSASSGRARARIGTNKKRGKMDELAREESDPEMANDTKGARAKRATREETSIIVTNGEDNGLWAGA